MWGCPVLTLLVLSTMSLPAQKHMTQSLCMLEDCKSAGERTVPSRVRAIPLFYSFRLPLSVAARLNHSTKGFRTTFIQNNNNQINWQVNQIIAKSQPRKLYLFVMQAAGQAAALLENMQFFLLLPDLVYADTQTPITHHFITVEVIHECT
jgi:hypothetical protein